MIKFEYTDDENDTTVTITTDAVLLDRIIEIFERFLKSMGHDFDGNLDFLSDEDMDDAYNRGYSEGLAERDEPQAVDTPEQVQTRYRVKSVKDMEKILGVGKGRSVAGGKWGWSVSMWDTCGKEVKPDNNSPYRYSLEDTFFYLTEWVEEIPE